MAQTAAERQRDWRQRRTRRISELEAELDARERALEAENAAKDAEIEGLRSALAVAEAELERLAGQQCRHPASAVDGGTCRACGAEVW